MSEHAPKPAPDAGPSASPPPPQRLNLSAITPEHLAMLLSNAYPERVTAEQIRRLVQQGAPQNPDGTIHFVIFLAWLIKRIRQLGNRP